MARSLLSPVAERDLLDLFERRLDYSDRAANALVDAVLAVVRRLEDHPWSGSPRPELGDGVRAAHVNTYRTTLYYLVTEAPAEPVVTVLRILRQERDVGGADFGSEP